MGKKEVVKKIPVKVTKKNNDVERILVENFVSLQRVMTNLSVKFDNLSTQISKLLELFEISAKTLAEKSPNLKDVGGNKNVVEKLDNLLEQNKVIARGLTLLHETNPQQLSPHPAQPQQFQQLQPPRNPMMNQTNRQKPNVKMDEYQKSVSSNPNESN